MKNDVILIRYGELSLKSTYVRNSFESTLLRNIRHALVQESIQGTVKREWGRFYLYTDDISSSCTVLQRVFGVVSLSPSVETTSDLNDISACACTIATEVLNKKTSFAIRATRAGTHSFTSQDVAIRIGNDIVKTIGSPVNLTNPDVELFIEIRNKKAFLFTEKIHGPGGLPMDTQGKVLAMIDTPYSLAAAWYVMHRGCAVHFINLDKSNLHTLQAFMKQWYVNAEITTLDSRRKDFFDVLNALSSEKKCDALVTGFSFNEDRSTMDTVERWKKQCTIPVLHPLIAFDKTEIQTKCTELGITL